MLQVYDRNDLIKIIKEKHDAIVNSEELGSRSDGVMPISNRQVMSDDFTNFSSLVEGLNILCNENAWYPLLEGIGGAELKTLSTREIERIIGDKSIQENWVAGATPICNSRTTSNNFTESIIYFV